MIHNEAGVKTATKKLLKDHGWFVWMPPANGYGRVGISDIHALKGGQFLAIETKAPGRRGNLSPNQKHRIEEINAANGVTIVVDDVAQLDQLENDDVLPRQS